MDRWICLNNYSHVLFSKRSLLLLESNDNAPQILKNITNIEEGDQPVATEPTASVRERKKSITFNESVERIEIETEVPVSASTYQF